MNNQMPFFNPFNNFQVPNNPIMNNSQEEKIMNKIERLEKNIRILENRIRKLEKNSNNDYLNDEPTDMYII